MTFAKRNWSQFGLALIFCLLGAVSVRGEIQALEFFIGVDPGEGNGTAIAITPSNDATFVPDLSGLGVGTFRLHVRAQDSEGVWGLPADILVVIVEDVAEDNQLAGAEFYMDSDPGEGNASAITLTGTQTGIGSFTVDLDFVEPGTQYVHIRAQDQFGRWGFSSGQFFSIQPPDITALPALTDWQFTDSSDVVVLTTTSSVTGTPGMPSNPLMSDPDISGLAIGERYNAVFELRDAFGTITGSGAFDFVLVPPDIALLTQFFTLQEIEEGFASFLMDFDGDGQPTGLEIAVGSNPRAASSVFQPSLSVDTGFFQISYPQIAGGNGTPGVDYTVNGLRYVVFSAASLTSGEFDSGADVVAPVGEPEPIDDDFELVGVRQRVGLAENPTGYLRLEIESVVE